MLDNTITKSVALANTATMTDIVWTRTDFFNTRSLYTGPNHSLTLRDQLNFYRGYPTKVGNSNGVAKPSFKLTIDQSVPGVDASTTLTAPLLGEVTFNVPVGTTAAQCIELRQKMIALLDDDTLMGKLFGLEV